MSARYCKCTTPKPRPAGVGRTLCVNQNCHKEIAAARGASNDILPADLQALQDRINRLRSSVDAFCDELTAQVQSLKRQA